MLVYQRVTFMIYHDKITLIIDNLELGKSNPEDLLTIKIMHVSQRVVSPKSQDGDFLWS